MAGLQQHKGELEALGATIFAASVDPADKAAEAAPGVTFPIGIEVTRDQADAMGAWWGEMRGGIIQPTEFLIRKDGTILHTLYASGPVGRMQPEELVRQLTTMDQREREAAQKG